MTVMLQNPQNEPDTKILDFCNFKKYCVINYGTVMLQNHPTFQNQKNTNSEKNATQKQNINFSEKHN